MIVMKKRKTCAAARALLGHQKSEELLVNENNAGSHESEVLHTNQQGTQQDQIAIHDDIKDEIEAMKMS